jgi:hypothetical protein
LPADVEKTATRPWGAVRDSRTKMTPASTIRRYAALKSSTRRKNPTRLRYLITDRAALAFAIGLGEQDSV